MELDPQLELFDRLSPPPHPGERLKKFLSDLGWSQRELAIRIGIDRPATITAIVQGKKGITAPLALQLAEVLDTRPDYWMRLQAAYDLYKEEQSFSPKVIQERSRIYDMAPVREMEKRGWVSYRTKESERERELCSFFEVASLEEEPHLLADARSSNSIQGLTPSQRAWCYRSLKLARLVKANRFSESRFSALLSELRNLSYLSRSTEDIPWLLADYGIRFVIVEPILRCKIDGAAFWIDRNSPVIALSLRLDRIDNFWFVLMHELSHIINRDSIRVDSDLTSPKKEERSEIESRADRDAARFLIPSEELDSFIQRTSPLYSKKKIIQFANRVKVHPGIVVGQLQFRGELMYSQGRQMLVRVRDHLIDRTLTDGWGYQAPNI